MDFLIYLLKVAALAMVVLLFACAASSIIIDQYFDRKEQFIKDALKRMADGLEAGMKGIESLLKKQ